MIRFFLGTDNAFSPHSGSLMEQAQRRHIQMVRPASGGSKNGRIPARNIANRAIEKITEYEFV